MRSLRALVRLGFVLLAATSHALAHSGAPAAAATPGEPPVAFKLEKLSERAYCLYGKGGNVGFLVTGAGVLVVDDQYGDVAPGIVEQIKKVTDRPIRYLVNTHYHSDHTGGNPVFAAFAEIIAHDTVRPRLLEYPRTVLQTFPDRIKATETEVAGLKDPADRYRAALLSDLDLMKFLLEDARAFKIETVAPPRLTFDSRLTVFLGDQRVEIVHVAPAHTDGDAMVFFPGEKVVHVGDIFFNGMYPFIDALAGGSENGYIKNIDYVLAHVPPDTRVIPGHGAATDLAALKRYRDFLADLRAEVEKAVKAGKSRIEAIRGIRMDGYPEIKPLFRTLGNEIAVTYDEVKAGR